MNWKTAYRSFYYETAPEPEDPVLPPAETALLCIDVQNYGLVPKPTAEERDRVDYAGIDIADPTDKFSVAAYLDAVRPVFESGRDIIVAGGTGLYVKCLTEGFDDLPPENEMLRVSASQALPPASRVPPQMSTTFSPRW